jgi:hypothetical protein
MTIDPTDFSSFEVAQLQTPRSRNSVRFEEIAVVNKAKSDAAGYPVHDMTVRAFIRVPGSRDEFPTKLDDKFMAEYGHLYERWKKTQEQPVDGLALELWPPIPKSYVEDWKYFGVRTVQQLATMGDTQLQKLGMGAREWQKKAESWLKEAQDHAESQRLVSENEKLKDEISMLKTQIADIAAKKPEPAPPVDMTELAKLVAAQMKAA